MTTKHHAHTSHKKSDIRDDDEDAHIRESIRLSKSALEGDPALKVPDVVTGLHEPHSDAPPMGEPAAPTDAKAALDASRDPQCITASKHVANCECIDRSPIEPS